jgi:hypothetical protein
MKRVKQAAYGGLLATTVDPDILLNALMDSWKTEVELAQLTVEKRLCTIFTDAVKAQAKALTHDSEHDGSEPVPEPELLDDAADTDEEPLPDAIKLRLAYTKMVAANRDGTLGLYRGCTPRILSAVFADGVRRWVEETARSAKRSRNATSTTGPAAGGAGDLVLGINIEEVQVGLTSAVAGGQSHPARPVELAKAISEGLGHAGLVAVPPTELNIFPSQEKIAASASKGRKLKK